jgi:Mn-containing catalase
LGEISTLNNDFFRNKGRPKPFYSLLTAITAEEFGHVGLATNRGDLVARGPDIDLENRDVAAAPFTAIRDARTTANFFTAGCAASGRKESARNFAVGADVNS